MIIPLDVLREDDHSLEDAQRRMVGMPKKDDHSIGHALERMIILLDVLIEDDHSLGGA
jgi:hypothetical protein